MTRRTDQEDKLIRQMTQADERFGLPPCDGAALAKRAIEWHDRIRRRRSITMVVLFFVGTASVFAWQLNATSDTKISDVVVNDKLLNKDRQRVGDHPSIKDTNANFQADVPNVVVSGRHHSPTHSGVNQNGGSIISTPNQTFDKSDMDFDIEWQKLQQSSQYLQLLARRDEMRRQVKSNAEGSIQSHLRLTRAQARLNALCTSLVSITHSEELTP